MDLRIATPADSAAIAGLVCQLGYLTEEGEMRARLERLLASPDELVAVAIIGNEVAGVIELTSMTTIEAAAHAEIRALVVSDRHRGGGAGAALVAFAETWARERGLSRIRVRSRVEREHARRFYEREGYAVTKSQNVFDKKL